MVVFSSGSLFKTDTTSVLSFLLSYIYSSFMIPSRHVTIKV